MQSTAHVARHPLHTMLVHFPIAFWLGSFVADVIAAANGTAHDFGFYLAVAGCVGAGVAAIPGFIDLVGTILPEASARVRKIAISHAITNVVALAAWLASVLLRPAPELNSDGAWIASCFGLVLVSVGGYLGGRLVYEFRVGVSEAGDHRKPTKRPPLDLGGYRGEPMERDLDADVERDPRKGVA